MATADNSSDDIPFWRRKSLDEMTDSEWESLCDGCGRCCLNKLEEEGNDADTYYTDVGCRLLDGETCRCRDYANRLEQVDDCVRLTPKSLKTITWLPPSCAYVLLAAEAAEGGKAARLSSQNRTARLLCAEAGCNAARRGPRDARQGFPRNDPP